MILPSPLWGIVARQRAIPEVAVADAGAMILQAGEGPSVGVHIAPYGRTLQPQPHYQGPARWAVEAYVPRLITSPSS